MHEYVIACAESYIKWVEEGHGDSQQEFGHYTEKSHSVTDTV
jgi:hypothetical protein